jgi:hypothetical protein
MVKVPGGGEARPLNQRKTYRMTIPVARRETNRQEVPFALPYRLRYAACAGV